MGFIKPIEQYLFCNLLTKMHVFMYLKDIIRGVKDMIKIDLITGFLGSGKSTFLKKYASYTREGRNDQKYYHKDLRSETV